MTITVLHAIDTTGPGGAETVFVQLASRLSGSHRSVAVIRGTGWVEEELKRRGVETHVIEAKGSFNVGYLRGLVKLIRAQRVDVVHSHLFGSNVYCSLAGALCRVPVISTFHGEVDIGGGERYVRQKGRVIDWGSWRTVFVSDHLKARVAAALNLRENRTCTIHNAVDLSRFGSEPNGALREELGISKDALLVGSVGNVRAAKGYEYLIEAAHLLNNAGLPVHFAIAGQAKGRLYDRLTEHIAQLGVEDRVHFAGFVKDIGKWLNGLDAFLLSSTSEGFSISTLEAQACGIPVIVTRSGGPEEFVDHEANGLVIDSHSSESIAWAVTRIFHDRRLRTAMALEGRRTARERFSLERMIEEYEALYSGCLAENRQRSTFLKRPASDRREVSR